MDVINCLPNESLEQIFQFLNVCDLLHCSQVCKRWRFLLADARLWNYLFTSGKCCHSWVDKQIMSLLRPDEEAPGRAENGQRFEKNEMCFRSAKIEKLMDYLAKRFDLDQIFLNRKSSTTPVFTYPTFKKLNSLIMGPGVDTTDVGDSFLIRLFEWIDPYLFTERSAPFNLHNLPRNPWAGRGLSIRIPTLPGQDVKLPILNVTVLHARAHTRRSNYPDGGSRLEDSFLIEPNENSELPAQLNSESQIVVRSSHLIFYVVNVTIKNRQTSGLNDSPEADDTNWFEIYSELKALMNCMSHQQTLIIVGLTEETAVYNPTCAFDTATKLTEAACEFRKQYSEVDTISPDVNWRLWCTESDGTKYSNLREIFVWAVMDYFDNFRVPDS